VALNKMARTAVSDRRPDPTRHGPFEGANPVMLLTSEPGDRVLPPVGSRLRTRPRPVA
jgi:hypothetical protein